MLIIKGRRYDSGEPVSIRIEGERIAEVEPAWPEGDLAEWPYVAPGLLDLQVNGYGGIWYSSPDLTPEQVLASLEPFFAHGVTRLCPTLITAGFETLAAGFDAIRRACEQEVWAERMIAGCHLEGPYISIEDGPRGAHPREHVRPANWDEFSRLQHISGNRIRLVTLAPESPSAVDFIRRAVASAVTIAIGHTGAAADQIQAAVEAGARLSTHLGNGAHGMLRRHPNYIWEQLGEPRLYASVISDGHHLPASVLRTIMRAKSTSRVILTCDAAGWAGCPPGVYTHGSGKFELLPDGRIVIAGQDQLLAGSSLATDTCVANAVHLAGASLRDAVDMAGKNPARLLGLESIRLARGCRADLFLFHVPGPGHPLTVRATVALGKLRFGEISLPA